MQNYSFVVADEQQLDSCLKSTNINSDKFYLAQICSTSESETALRLSAVLQKRLKNVTVLGHSTSHFIYEAKVVNQGCLVLITEFESTSITSALIPVTENYTEESLSLTGKLALSPETKAVICFADDIDSKDNDVFSSFNSFSPSIPVAGGLSQLNEFGTWVLLNNQIANHAIVAAALHNKELTAWHQGFIEWNPVGRTFEVTEAEGNKVLTLDNTNCYDIYKRYLADGKPLPIYDLKSFPLIRGKRINQDIFVPENITEDNEIEFNLPLSVGDRVRFSYNHPSLTLEQVQLEADKLREEHPDIIFVYNCSSRLNFAEGDKELLQFDAVAPTHGSYFSGELFSTDQPRILHHSLTYLALREGEKKEAAVRQPDQPSKRDKISPLFSLIHNAIADIDKAHSNMGQRLTEQTRRLTESYRVDRLTGLPNRIALVEQLDKMVLNEHLITTKLTNLYQINEKYGYHIGDQLLREISQYCNQLYKNRFPDRSLFCIGTGELAGIFKSDKDSNTIQSIFYDFVEDLEHRNFRPDGLSEMDHLSVSVYGGVVSRRDYPNLPADELLIKSIEARRYAKENNRHVYTAKQLQPIVDKRHSQLDWLSVVSRAIIENNVMLYAQPIYAAITHKQISHECLVRIREGDKVISPGQFLPIIEGTHLYTRLSRQMIHNTFTTMKGREGKFSLNLSPQDLMSDNTIQLLERHIRTFSNPERIGLEVLETEEIKDYGRMREVCGHLRKLGATIIVDDFGSGYSNIDEIIKLEPQIIKLDGSLIKNMDTDKKQRKVTRALVQLCQELGTQTVAEFVHNKEVCSIAEDMGFDYLQGFYLAEPNPL